MDATGCGRETLKTAEPFPIDHQRAEKLLKNAGGYSSLRLIEGASEHADFAHHSREVVGPALFLSMI
ncbi:MAG: hypothetical protein AB7S42_05000 [Lysobacteraceae bacterium]